MRWKAARARSQTWYPTIVEIMTSIHSADTLKRLHISLSGTRSSDLTDEVALLEKYANLAIEISSARCWSNAQFTICLPSFLAVVHHADTAERERGMRYIKKLWDCVLIAEKTLSDDKTDVHVRDALDQVLTHMAWHKGQIAREIYLQCRAADWKHTDQQVRQLAFSLFGTHANTKHFLEDTFSHLADVAKRIARHVRLSKKPGGKLKPVHTPDMDSKIILF